MSIMDFSHIENWVFDLDNTLYPAKHNLFDQVDQRMTDFIANALDVDALEARHLQKLYLKDYGTTLAGLMQHHNMQPDAFLEFVHDVDVSVLPPSPSLCCAIDRLPGRKYIFTNGTHAHAQRVMQRLGIDHQFDDIFDIIRANYMPKPAANIYTDMLNSFGLKAQTTAFFEDMPRNLKPAHDLGLTTILIRSHELDELERSYHGDDDADHVHHTTHCLETFLTNIKFD